MMSPPSLPVCRLRFSLGFDHKIPLPRFTGPLIRGAFGNALRHTACSRPELWKESRRCEPCQLRFSCPYSYIFESPLPPGSLLMRKYPQVPHPFVIEPEDNRKPDEDLTSLHRFNISLFGRAIPMASYAVTAVERLCSLGLTFERFPCVLKTVSVNCGQDDAPFYAPEGREFLLPPASLPPVRIPALPDSCHRLTVRFLTPLRILRDGKLLISPVFTDLISASLRRIEILSAFHADSEGAESAGWDIASIIEESRRVKRTAAFFKEVRLIRHSMRQDRDIPIEGIVGEAVFEGAIAPFLPILALAELVHIGKSCSFGLGRIRISLRDLLDQESPADYAPT